MNAHRILVVEDNRKNLKLVSLTHAACHMGICIRFN